MSEHPRKFGVLSQECVVYNTEIVNEDKTMRSLTAFLLIAGFLVHLTCSTDAQRPETPTLEEVTWRLQSFDLITESIDAVRDQGLTLHLMPDMDGEHRAFIQADCNSCGGPY